MNHRAAVLILSLAGMITACKSEEQKRAEETAKNLEQASKQMAEASKNAGANMGDAMAAMGAAVSGAANAGKKVETVDYKELKAMLPESLPGMKRTDASGEKNAATSTWMRSRAHSARSTSASSTA